LLRQLPAAAWFAISCTSCCCVPPDCCCSITS
jgi:hypothetical protein